MANLSNINNKFLVTTGGNVGINTTSPAEKLEVSGGHIKIINSGNTNLYINANNSGSDSTIFFQETNSTKAKIQHDASNDSMLFTDGAYTDTMTLKGGKVGIGTTSPNEKLQVAGNIHAYAPSGIDAGLFASTAAGSTTIAIRSSGVTHFNGGNVGIGTISPDRVLDVRGNGLSIYGSGDNTELMLRGQVEGTGTVRNVGAFHLSIRSDVGGDNDDLKFLRFVTGTYSGIAMQIQNTTGTIIGNGIYTSGNSIKIFEAQRDGGAVKSDWSYDDATTDMSLGTSTAHSFSLKTGNTRALTINSSQNVGIGTTSPATKLNVANAGEVIVRSSMTAADGYRGGFEADNQHTGGTIWSMFSTNNSDGYFGGGKFVIANESMGGVDANTTAKFVIDGSGNVGIGNTSPSDFLSWQKQLVVGNGSYDAGITIYHGSGGGNQGAIVFADGNTGTNRYRGIISYNGADEMKFFTSTLERIKINDAGNVFISTPITNAFYGLSLTYNNTNTADFTVNQATGQIKIGGVATGYFPTFYSGGSERMRITTSAQTMVLKATDTVGSNYLQFQNSAGTNQGYMGFGSGSTNDLIISCESASVPIRFFNGGAEKMRIESNGNVGIGITNPQDKLHVDGDAIISSNRYGDYAVGGLDTTGVVVATVTGSGNGASASIEFVGMGGVNGIVDVVYNCTNQGGNWYVYKNERQTARTVDVVATGNGTTTLTFTFKAISSSQGYTPRIRMIGSPYNLITF